MVRFAAHLAALLALAGSCLAAGQKPVYLISFHEEGESMEPPRTLQDFEINGEKRHFRKMPVLTQRNFKAYWAFPAEDGKSWGAVFWLDNSGQHVVERLGVANREQYLAVAVNRTPVDVQTIDKAPTDGRIVVWKGIPAGLFKIIDKEKKIRRVGPAAGTDAASTAARRSKDAPAPRTSQKPPGAPLPDDAVVGRIDAATLDSATRDLKRATPPAKRPSKPAKPAQPVATDGIPFTADPTIERPDLVPLPDAGVKRK
jgi:hypothetical protein